MMKKIIILSLILSSISLSTVQAQDNKVLLNLTASNTDFQKKYSQIDKSAKGLEEYKKNVEDIQNIAEENGGTSFFSTITLSQPLAVGATIDMIEEYAIIPQLLYVFAFSNDDKMVTLGIKPDPTSPSPSIKNSITYFEKESSFKILGIVAIVGNISIQEIFNTQLDPKIFLVDITADEKLADNPANKKHMHHFGWDLYFSN